MRAFFTSRTFFAVFSILLLLASIPVRAYQIDLRHVRFDEGETVFVEGEWEFYWEQLYAPTDFQTDRPAPSYTVAPLSWHQHTAAYPRLGYATYRTQLQFPPQHRNLSLLLPAVHCAATIWLNGKEVAKIGKVGKTGDEYRGNISTAVITIPENTQTAELVIQVANFTAYKGGLTEEMLVGDASVIARRLSISKGVESFFAGSLIAMFIQQMILFLMFRRGKAYLYLSLICLAVAVRALITNSTSFLFPDLFPSVPFEVWRKAEFFSVYAIVAFFPLYVASLFPEQVKKNFLRALVALAAVLCLVVLITPLYFYGRLLDVAHAGLLGGFVFSFWVIFKAWANGNTDARIIFWGVAASFPFVFAEILKNSFLRAEVPFDLYLVELGVLVFLLFQVYMLSNHFSNSYTQLEVYSHSLENSVRQRTEELSKSNEIKDKLLSIVAHDLRSPLHSLKGILNVYKVGAVTKDEMDPFVARIEDELDRNNILVDNILFWATDQMQGEGINVEALDVHSLTEEHIMLFGTLASRKNIKLVNAVTPRTLALADKSILGMVLRNLISNAIKFTNENGTVVIADQKETGQVILSIEDSGVGMSEEQVNALFTTKLMKSARGTANEKGAGIGLSLCSDYVKKMGGSLWVESILGKGSKFYVSLPAQMERSV